MSIYDFLLKENSLELWPSFVVAVHRVNLWKIPCIDEGLRL
jgi:hypothetical protein